MPPHSRTDLPCNAPFIAILRNISLHVVGIYQGFNVFFTVKVFTEHFNIEIRYRVKG